MTPNKLDILYGYIDRGWAITPDYSIYKNACNCPEKSACKNAGKHHIFSGDITSNNKDQIKAWSEKWKYANWSVKNGKESGIISFDIDPRNGGKRDAFPFPPTLEYRTGGGGWRLIYKYPNFPIEDNSDFGTGVELMVDKFMIVPPSLHISGGKYEWKDYNTPIAEIPQSFILLGNTPVSKEKERYELPDEIFQGSRDEELYKYCCSLRASGGGMEYEEILSAAKTVNKTRFNPPLDDETVIKKAEQACKFEKGVRKILENKPDVRGDESPDSIKERFVIYTAEDMLAQQPPINWIVNSVISVGSVSVFHGDGGTGKTRSLTCLAVSVANGKPWLDFSTVKTPVLWIDEEGGRKRTTRWLGEALRGQDCDNSSDLYASSLAGFKADNKGDCILLEKLIRNYKVGLVIIDVLAFVMGGDENSKEDVQPVFNNLKRVAEATSCAIILIHHDNKQGGIRGSTAIRDAVDLCVQVTKKQDSNIINFKEEKNRDGETIKFVAEADWGISPFGNQDIFTVRRSEAKEDTFKSKADEYVIRWITEHPNSTVESVMDNADVCSGGSAKNALYRLARLDEIHRTNTGKVATYSISTK
jgi:hypothetical protein